MSTPNPKLREAAAASWERARRLVELAKVDTKQFVKSARKYISLLPREKQALIMDNTKEVVIRRNMLVKHFRDSLTAPPKTNGAKLATAGKPSPNREPSKAATTNMTAINDSRDIFKEVKRCAEKVGGLDTLRAATDALADVLNA